jgi:hypothetical protein
VRTLRLALVGALTTVFVMTSPASAHLLSHADPEDAEDGLDLERVRLRVDELQLTGRVDFYDPRPAWVMRVEFDSRGSEGLDYYFFVSFDGGSSGLACGLHRRNGDAVRVSPRRLDCALRADTLRFEFLKRVLSRDKHLLWRVSTRLLSPEGIQDAAPDDGWFAH